MNIRLIALDLDGTLLDDRKRLSEVNRQALCACGENGILIVPATGRTVDGIPAVIKDIPGIRYAITTNGAVIEDMKEKRALDTRMLSCSLALEILRIVDGYHVMYDPYVDRRGITESRFYDHLSEYGLAMELQEMVRQTRDVHENIIQYVENSGKPVEKINLFFPEKEERARVRRLLEKRTDILITSSMPLNLELNSPEATKGKAIIRLASYLGLKREQTMAMGDGENDMSMIKDAGIGIAMRNGRPDLLENADYITDSNNEDGVAKAIYRFALKAGS